VRGPRGGYELARERRRITAGEIVRAAMATSSEESMPPVPDSALVDLVVGPVVRKAGEAFLEVLDNSTVEDLCRRAEEAKVFGQVPSSVDFTI